MSEIHIRGRLPLVDTSAGVMRRGFPTSVNGDTYNPSRQCSVVEVVVVSTRCLECAFLLSRGRRLHRWWMSVGEGERSREQHNQRQRT